MSEDVTIAGTGGGAGESNTEVKEDPKGYREEILVVVFALIIVFVVVGIFLLYSYLRTKTSGDTGGGNKLYTQCTVDECVTNILTGEKTCPSNGEELKATLPFEVCNLKFECNNYVTPYAVQEDGSTRSDGICEKGVACRCSRIPLCATFVRSTFTASPTNNNIPLNEQLITFTQQSTIGTVSSGAPSVNSKSPGAFDIFTISSSENQYCQVPAQWLNRSTPGCTFARDMDYDSIVQCMGLTGDESTFPYACNTLPQNINRELQIPLSSPCIDGKLAVVVKDDKLSRQNIDKYPFACVGTDVSCPCGEVMVQHYKQGVICLRL